MPDTPVYPKHHHPGHRPVARSKSASTIRKRTTSRYAELRCQSNFSFLRGASHPEELAEQAARLGYAALAITDRNTLAGVVRMHCAAKACGLRLIIGAEITPVDAPPILLYATDRAGYGRLCRIITQGRLRAIKGDCIVSLSDVTEWNEGLLAAVPAEGVLQPVTPRGLHPESQALACANLRIFGTPLSPDDSRRLKPAAQEELGNNPDPGAPQTPERSRRLKPAAQKGLVNLDGVHTYREIFGDRLYLAAGVHGGPDDERYLMQVNSLSHRTGVPLVAVNDVHYHIPERRFLQDVVTCVREHCTLDEAGRILFANAERHLKSIEDIQRLFADYPQAVARTVEIADRCHFSLDELRYEYPEALCPPGREPSGFLAELTWAGAKERYPDGLPEDVRRLIQHELELIRKLQYEPYFLTVWDIVKFARARDILCQGRGSAANSAVCYCLGITSVDPERIDLLFERFVSAERNEPPDIDVDFEHERREEVFQYIYDKYGRDHAGLVAEVITYRPRSAIRDVGKALGLSLDRVAALAKKHEWWDKAALREDFVREAGFDPFDRTVRMMVKLVRELIGFPRHLSQHVGGFVITRGPLCEMVPIENGAMPGRTFIEWDKDDVDALGILKIDCLALGMLTGIHKCLMLLQEEVGEEGLREAGIKGLREGEYKLGTAWRHVGSGCIGENCECQENVSRSCGVEKEPRSGQNSLPGYKDDAGKRAFRADRANASSSGVDSVEHCRGQCTADTEGLRPLPDDRAGIIGRIGNTAYDRTGTKHAKGSRPSNGMRYGDQPLALSADPQPAEQTKRGWEQFIVSGPDSAFLNPSIPQSLNPCVPTSLSDVPPEDPAVYDMICRADTVGVFQIESRAQMSMLPRLRPRCFYDLVIEVAIVRPGPIQGGMVHPYLRRRAGEEAITYPSEAIREVLQKTLGVPLFQEQAMRLAVVAAGFSPGEADQLRRAMGAWRRNGDITRFRAKLIEGMRSNGLSEEFAERCFQQISGFGEYGFPESHAASFALLVYVSAWLKRYYPAAFCAAIINSQPMGFYQPAQLVRDAREHGVTVLPVDVNYSGYDCRLEGEEATERRSDGATKGREGTEGRREEVQSAIRNPQAAIENPEFWGVGGPAVRLGMRLVKGLSKTKVEGIERAQRDGPFRSVADLARRSGVATSTLARLAAADAMRSLGLNRREALWQVLALSNEPELFDGAEPDEPAANLPEESLKDTVYSDYEMVGLSLNAHPMALIRAELNRLRIQQARTLRHQRNGHWARVAGLVLVRQRPSTALGIVFCTLEDETGTANLVIRPAVFERYRHAAAGAVALLVEGRVERQGDVVHLNTTRIEDLSKALSELRSVSRDFH